MQAKSEYYVMGDGNCGPRAVIQNLLLEGLAYPAHRLFVCAFLRGLCERQGDNPEPYVHSNRYLNSPLDDTIFGEHDPRPDNDLHRLPHNKKDRLKNQVLMFINTYETLATTEENLDLLISKFIPNARGVRPTHDHLIYLLAAYLRFDMATEISRKNQDYQTILNGLQEEVNSGATSNSFDDIINANNTLEENIHAALMGRYLANHKIGYVLRHINDKFEMANNEPYLMSPELSLNQLTTGLHFSFQWDRPRLAATHDSSELNIERTASANEFIAPHPELPPATSCSFLITAIQELCMMFINWITNLCLWASSCFAVQDETGEPIKKKNNRPS